LFLVGFACLALGLIIGRGFGWGGFGGFGGFDSWDDQEPVVLVTPVATTAVEFSDTFRANADAARSRFANRPLLVTGTVVRLDKVDHPWGPDVLLATSDPAKTVLADLLPESHAAAGSLKAGQVITVGCEQVDESFGPDPWLKNCRIEQVPAAPQPPPAAEPPTAPPPPAEP
jgi:hypothetical protein